MPLRSEPLIFGLNCELTGENVLPELLYIFYICRADMGNDLKVLLLFEQLLANCLCNLNTAFACPPPYDER